MTGVFDRKTYVLGKVKFILSLLMPIFILLIPLPFNDSVIGNVIYSYNLLKSDIDRPWYVIIMIICLVFTVLSWVQNIRLFSSALSVHMGEIRFEEVKWRNRILFVDFSLPFLFYLVSLIVCYLPSVFAVWNFYVALLLFASDITLTVMLIKRLRKV